METVKVDIQKLQLLNDRIAQTLEALNLLRMSVHGIQHSQAVSPWGYGVGALPYSVQPQFGSPYVGYPGAQFGYPQYGTPFVPGIQHTQTQFGYPTQLGYPTTQVTNPYAQTQFAQTPYTQTQFTSPYTSFVPGIQHTAPQTWTQPTGWTNPQWTNPQWTTPQWTTPQGWTTPNWQTNGISHSAWEPTWQMRPWTWNQTW